MRVQICYPWAGSVETSEVFGEQTSRRSDEQNELAAMPNCHCYNPANMRIIPISFSNNPEPI